MSLFFTLEGDVPSKKNAWRRGSGKAYLPAQMQADIDALVWQAKAIRGGSAFRVWRHGTESSPPLSVDATFHWQGERKDLDNMLTTLLDVLQKAGLVENDRMIKSLWARIDNAEGAKKGVSIGLDVMHTLPTSFE